ncbi:hypothetical protein AJ78_03825 [Emergomyces pasteurianus Ep9510]|uniref:Uncharacterized protein n=1 Tax=Emergomyces pasteurianus Ep9510 TaxID=1447872 RepID=A0A1J9QJ81_9EURO|nr:hypothetical protein AJ78_03825 [Emergomyces pasteurianus Ep9510]
MHSDSPNQQPLLDTIERSFYQKLPSDSQEHEGQRAGIRPPEINTGIGASSSHPYQPHPVTPKGQEKTQNTSLRHPGQQHQHQQSHEIFGHPTSGLIFMLRWGCAILTVAATILFGVWAPLSYQATKEANRESDETQRALMRSAKSANAIASSALYAASQQLEIATAQASVLSNLQVQLAAMGQVALLQFCNAQTKGDFAPCSAFVNSAEFTSLVSQIATPIPTVPRTIPTNTDTSRPTRSPSDSAGDNSRGSSQISIPSILAIVFGGTAALGILTGYLVWRHHQGKLKSRPYY